MTLTSFIAGTSYGFWRAKRAQKNLAETASIRMLCPESWYSTDALERVSKKLSTPIQLFTYANPSEFVRQMANTDSNIDVICTSSFLLRSLIQSHWLKKIDVTQLKNIKQLSVDFANLPFDRNFEYGVPLFWNLFGLFGRADTQPPTLKSAIESHKAALWGDELLVLHLMSLRGMRIEERLNMENDQSLENDIRSFIASAPSLITKETEIKDGLALVAAAPWTLIPVSQASRWTKDNNSLKFWLPEDGGVMEIGILAVGEKSLQADKALAIINELISLESALELHKKLNTGAVNSSLSHLEESVSPMQRPEALRQFPLNRLKFPDVGLDSIPRFQKIFDETVTSNRK